MEVSRGVSGAHRLVPVRREPGDVALVEDRLLQGSFARQVLVVCARCTPQTHGCVSALG